MVRNLVTGAPKEEKKLPEGKDEVKEFEIKHLQTKLSSHFGTKIQIKRDEKNKGEIKIPFASEEDLSQILEIIDI